MAVFELNLVILHGALIVLYSALILEHDLFLIVEQLLVDGILRPCIAIAVHIHLGLGKNVGISLQRALGFEQLRLVGAGIDVDQRIAFLDELPFCVMYRGEDAAGLRGDVGGVDRGDGPDGIEIYADAAFRGIGNGCLLYTSRCV